MPERRSPSPFFGFLPQIFILVLIPLAVLIVVVVYAGLNIYNSSLRQLAGQEDLRTLRAIGATLTEQVQHREDALLSLGARAGDNPAQAAAILDSSDFLLNGFDGGIAFFDRQATRLAASPAFHADTLAPASVDALLSSLPPLGHTPAAFSPDVIAPATGGDPLVLLAARAGPNLEVVGAFTPGRLLREETGAAYGPSSVQVYLLDPYKNVLFQDQDSLSPGQASALPGATEALRGESGVDYLPGFAGGKVVAFTQVPPLGWALVSGEPWQAVAGIPLPAVREGALVILPVAMLALLLLWFGFRMVVQPLYRLRRSINEMGWGNFLDIQAPVGGISEIRGLQSSLAKIARQLELSQKGMHGLIGSVEAEQAEERLRLALALRETALQPIINLGQDIQQTRRMLNGHPAGKRLEAIRAMTLLTAERLEQLMDTLHPVKLDRYGLAAALLDLVQQASRTAHLPIQFESGGEPRRLPGHTELSLYRMAQEALENVVQHAQATQAWVKLEYFPDGVVLTVRDDGRGFTLPETTAEFAQQGHYGLLGLYERAEQIEADLILETIPGKGTRVIITVPDGQV